MRIIIFILISNILFGQSERSRPNIIFVMFDDTGYDYVIDADNYVNPDSTLKSVELPNFRGLMKDSSLFFTRFHASAQCGPSRSQVMTGKHNYVSYQQFSGGQRKERVLPKLLNWGGYSTAHFGIWKWWNNTDGTGFYSSPSRPSQGHTDYLISKPEIYGFDEFYSFGFTVGPGRFELGNCEELFFNGVQVDCDTGEFGPDKIFKELLDYIDREKNTNDPFFAYYTPTMPHFEYEPTPSHPDFPLAGGTGDLELDKFYFPYMVEHIDSLSGVLFKKIANDPKLSEGAGTLVIYTFDNGTQTADRYGHEYQIGATTFEGRKGQPVFSGTHVPLYVQYVGDHKKYTNGDTYDGVAGLVDVFATILDAAKLGYESKYNGVSFADEILDYVPNVTNRELLFQYFNPVFFNNGQRSAWVTDGFYWLRSNGVFNRFTISNSNRMQIVPPSTDIGIYNSMVLEMSNHPLPENFDKRLTGF